MVRKLFFVWIVLMVSVYADLYYLVQTTPTATALDSAGGTTWGASNDDSVHVTFGSGFTFPFNGTAQTGVYINSNGMLNFNANNTEHTNQALYYATVPQSIYPYWDRLYPAALLSGGTIKYGILGSGDTQRFVVTWTNVSLSALCPLGICNKVDFQVVLYKNGEIRFRYPSGGNSADGSSATIGAQENTTYYKQHTYNQNNINQTFDILYILKPLIAVDKTSCAIYDPVNGAIPAHYPKRIPGGTIRYAIQISNTSAGVASNVFATDTVDNSALDTSTIKYLQIQSGACNCTGVSSANNNGSGGSGDSVNPVILDYGSLLGGSTGSPTRKCGYFEVNIK